jgi:hypothetical protein
LRQALRDVLPLHLPWYLRLKIRLRAALSNERPNDRVNLLWWHFAPQVRNRTRSYQPRSSLGLCHMFGRAEWLDLCGPPWLRLASAKLAECRGPHPTGHHSVINLPAAEVWLELILKEAKSGHDALRKEEISCGEKNGRSAATNYLRRHCEGGSSVHP